MAKNVGDELWALEQSGEDKKAVEQQKGENWKMAVEGERTRKSQGKTGEELYWCRMMKMKRLQWKETELQRHVRGNDQKDEVEKVSLGEKGAAQTE